MCVLPAGWGAECAVGSGLHEGKRVTPMAVDMASAAFTDRYDAVTRSWGTKRMTDGLVALYIFMLAAIAGHVIISRVPVILHTPLMSGSNFIHGIVLIGAMVVLGHADTTLEKVIGFVAVLLGAGNAAGGYVVTERMLEMFKPSQKKNDGGKA
jgi:NAD(P) transhydrogenase subunit alpha